MNLSDRSSLSILAVPNAYHTFNDHLSPAALANKRDGARKPLSAATLRQIALNFLLAGRDTLSMALSWFFWLIMNHPTVEEKILAELTTVLTSTHGNDWQDWTEEAVDFEEA
ncbi:hypothetical protein JHK87_022602 [Glycine soja]|nr:hypothetical protein JHK87_022602 [Glycine soja]